MSSGDSRLGRRRASGRLAWLLLGLPVFAGALRPSEADTGPGVSADEIRRHAAWLADDARTGRFPGTEGARAAARYIADVLARSGLRPLGDDGGWFQAVPLHGTLPEPSSELFLVSDCGSGPLRLGEDYLLFAGGIQALIPQPTPLVFAGYGIVAPEFDYNDYLGLDVAGKVVVVLTGEPDSTDPDYFAGASPTVYSSAEAKQRTALSRGARGTLIVDSALVPARPWDEMRREFAFEHLTLPYSIPRHLSARLRLQTAEKLFCDAPLALPDVFDAERGHTVRSFPLPARVWFRGEFRQRDFVADNVAGWLPGRDTELSQTYVLVSAHYDHLGIGPPVAGDTIYNGLVDNALGTAGVLELARALAALPRPPRRSVVFLLTTAEEEGLLGATHYVDHPLVPLHRTVANLNVDGLAHLDTFEDVVGIGAELSTLGKRLAEVARGDGLVVSVPPPPLAITGAYGLSDQAAFAEAGVPAILVKEGFRWTHHPPDEALARLLAWGHARYHQPSDDPSQSLDYEASRQHLALLLDLVVAIAEDPEEPRWRAGSHYEAARLRARAEGR